MCKLAIPGPLMYQRCRLLDWGLRWSWIVLLLTWIWRFFQILGILMMLCISSFYTQSYHWPDAMKRKAERNGLHVTDLSPMNLIRCKMFLQVFLSNVTDFSTFLLPNFLVYPCCWRPNDYILFLFAFSTLSQHVCGLGNVQIQYLASWVCNSVYFHYLHLSSHDLHECCEHFFVTVSANVTS